MGVSTICLIWLIYLCKHRLIPRGGIYWLPTFSVVKDFTDTKVDPLLRENAHILLEDKYEKNNKHNIGLKFICNTPTFWRGLESRAGVKSISGDAAIYDEFDEADMGQVKQARERLSASTVKLERELSIPTIPDYGIDAAFNETDQCHWVFICPGCNHINVLEQEFPKCFMQDRDGNYYRGCVRCKKNLDTAEAGWVQLNSSSPLRGYQISQLYSPFITPNELMKEYQSTEFMGHFYNHKLGLPYLAASDRVTADHVLSLCEGLRAMSASSLAPTSMGVDVGSKLHVTITQRVGERIRTLWMGEVDHFEELDPLVKAFSVRSGVIDALPETKKVREFCKRHSGKFYMCFYSQHQKGSYAWNESEYIVNVNRTESLDAGTDMLLKKQVEMPQRSAMVEMFAKHCGNIAKVCEEDKETGSKSYVYKKIGPDHFRHSFNYAMIAMTRISTIGFTSVFR